MAMVATRRRLGRRCRALHLSHAAKVSVLSANEADGVSAPSNRMAALRPPSGTTSTSLDHEHGGRHDCEPEVADASRCRRAPADGVRANQRCYVLQEADR